jgi:hypothetical protein
MNDIIQKMKEHEKRRARTKYVVPREGTQNATQRNATQPNATHQTDLLPTRQTHSPFRYGDVVECSNRNFYLLDKPIHPFVTAMWLSALIVISTY